jgi:methyl-accepting chemotaxis protein
LLNPGVQLMRRLRLPVKVGLIGLMLFVPMLLLLGALLHKGQASREFTLSERDGSLVVRQLMLASSHLQSTRGLNHRVLFGDTTATAERDEARRRLQTQLQAVDAELAATTRLRIDDQWPAVREAVAALAAGRHDASRATAYGEHTQQIEALRLLVLSAAERSGLLLDPEAHTYLLMDVQVERLLPWAESLERVRSEGAGLLTRGDANAAERARVLGRVEQLRRQIADVGWRAGALARAGETGFKAYEEAQSRSLAFADHAARLFSAEMLEGDSAAYFAMGTQAIDSVFAFGDEVHVRLESALSARAAHEGTVLWTQAAVSLAGVSLLAYFGTAFSVSLLGALRQLGHGMRLVADGDLSHKFDIQGRDEMAEIGRVVERMSERLSTMVAEIRSSAVRVSDTGQQLAGGSTALAERTEEQASSLRQFVATVGQLSTAVAGNAAEVTDLDNVTAQVHGEAAKGNQAMQQTVGALDALQTSSTRMTEIIGTIDGIAFQTNILALNAAVEAARAGEAGRGFAVVASEVRSLAQRSSLAAGEIRSLIARSREEVDSTVQRVQRTGESLQAVVGSVGQVSQRLRAIASSSNEQSQGLREMASAVGNLDEITRQNAAMVDESRSSSNALVDRAAALAQAVGSIKLRQGSADEARALVGRALALIRERGRPGAAEELHSSKAGFVDRDLYVFFVDRQGRYVLHGAKPAMEGKRVHDVPGIDGDRFVHDAFSAAAAGGGWIDYAIVNPVNGQVQAKASWVQALDDGLVIGCGIYRDTKSGPLGGGPAIARPKADQPRSASAGKEASPARRPAVGLA